MYSIWFDGVGVSILWSFSSFVVLLFWIAVAVLGLIFLMFSMNSFLCSS